jgi:hypothetical protein
MTSDLFLAAQVTSELSGVNELYGGRVSGAYGTGDDVITESFLILLHVITRLTGDSQNRNSISSHVLK